MGRQHEKQGCFNFDTCSGTCLGCTLFVCAVCGLYEGSLTTDCPGGPSYAEWADKVYEQGWDYKDGCWVPPASGKGEVADGPT